MTGPMYQDERMQELAEDNGYLKSKLRKAEIANAELAEKMEWSPEKWSYELDRANRLVSLEVGERIKMQHKLAETQAALEDALHDAKRWRAIAEKGFA